MTVFAVGLHPVVSVVKNAAAVGSDVAAGDGVGDGVVVAGAVALLLALGIAVGLVTEGLPAHAITTTVRTATRTDRQRSPNIKLTPFKPYAAFCPQPGWRCSPRAHSRQ